MRINIFFITSILLLISLFSCWDPTDERGALYSLYSDKSLKTLSISSDKFFVKKGAKVKIKVSIDNVEIKNEYYSQIEFYIFNGKGDINQNIITPLASGPMTIKTNLPVKGMSVEIYCLDNHFKVTNSYYQSTNTICIDETKTIWIKNPLSIKSLKSKKAWKDAVHLSASLKIDSISGFSLPSKEQLLTLWDIKKKDKSSTFDYFSDSYWSSTKSGKAAAFVISFKKEITNDEDRETVVSKNSKLFFIPCLKVLQ